MRLTFGDMTKEVNVFNLGKHPYDINDQPFEVNFIENMTSEHKEEITLESKDEEELESSQPSWDWVGSQSKFYRDGEFKLNTYTHQATSFLVVKDLA